MSDYLDSPDKLRRCLKTAKTCIGCRAFSQQRTSDSTMYLVRNCCEFGFPIGGTTAAPKPLRKCLKVGTWSEYDSIDDNAARILSRETETPTTPTPTGQEVAS